MPAQGDPQRALLDLLEHRNLLLMLDNCEHLIAPMRMDIRAVLLACPHLRVLATSRQVLAGGGEMTYRIQPLRLPDSPAATPLSPAEALENEALKLFVDRARAAKADFTLSAQTARRSARAFVCSNRHGSMHSKNSRSMRSATLSRPSTPHIFAAR